MEMFRECGEHYACTVIAEHMMYLSVESNKLKQASYYGRVTLVLSESTIKKEKLLQAILMIESYSNNERQKKQEDRNPWWKDKRLVVRSCGRDRHLALIPLTELSKEKKEKNVRHQPHSPSTMIKCHGSKSLMEPIRSIAYRRAFRRPSLSKAYHRGEFSS